MYAPMAANAGTTSPNGTGFRDRPAGYQILVISQKVVPVPAP
jgi:hypothetical protein